MTTLIVTLPLATATAATEFTCLLTPDGQSLGVPSSAVASLLPAASSEVVAVVPVQALSWHQIELPKGSLANATRLRAVLEGLLEERLLDEPDQLHFALQPGAKVGQRVWVAVCDRTWLKTALSVLETAGRRVSRVVPEFAPDDASQTTPVVQVIGEPDQAWLVTTHAGGVVLLPLDGPGANGSAPALPPMEFPDNTLVVAEPSVAAMAERLLQRPVTLRQQAQRQLLAAQGAWDLAQFDLSSTGGSRAARRVASVWRELLVAPQWRAARWAAIALVVVNLIGVNAWAWKQSTALQAKRDAIRSMLTTSFPSVKLVIDAPVQMAREIALLRQATGASAGADLESMLSALASAAPANRQINGVDYSNGQARIKGINLSPDETRNVAARLQTLGYQAQSDGDALVIKAGGKP